MKHLKYLLVAIILIGFTFGQQIYAQDKTEDAVGVEMEKAKKDKAKVKEVVGERNDDMKEKRKELRNERNEMIKERKEWQEKYKTASPEEKEKMREEMKDKWKDRGGDKVKPMQNSKNEDDDDDDDDNNEKNERQLKRQSGDDDDDDDAKEGKSKDGNAYGKKKGDYEGRDFGQQRARMAKERMEMIEKRMADRQKFAEKSRVRILEARERVAADKASGKLTEEQAAEKEAKIVKVESRLKRMQEALQKNREKMSENSKKLSKITGKQ